MWVYRHESERGWDIKLRSENAWEKYYYHRGEYVLYEIYFTPEGWLLANGSGGGSRADYHLHLIHNGHYIECYPLTFDEFDQFPSMQRGFFIPF